MKTITVDGKEYKIEFRMKSIECKNLIQKMFLMLSGAHVLRQLDNEGKGEIGAMMDGTANMAADTIDTTQIAFFAGLLQHHNMSEDEANELLEKYMDEKDIGFYDVFEEIKECMEDDGFFKRSGLQKMMEEMNKNFEELDQEEKKEPKKPQEHKKKQTSTK